MKTIEVPLPKLESAGSLIIFKDPEGKAVSLNSLLVHDGNVYEPSFGRLEGITVEQAEAHNRELDHCLVEHVKTLPVGGKDTMYLVARGGVNGTVTHQVTTWKGTLVSNHVVRQVSKAGAATIYFWIGKKEYRGRERKNDQLLNFRRIK